MPVNLTCETRLFCQRLSFGVPLEDLFSQSEIHPSLKGLFKNCYKNVVTNSVSIEQTIKCLQGSIEERLNLKERLVLSNDFTGLKVSPGALLWVVRHFLGLLPLPLLPQYTDGRKYVWKELSKICKASLANYVTSGQNNKRLIQQLADELLRLPPQNLLLVASLFHLLRMLAVLPGGETRINKSSVFALVKYFSSSLFLRPFRPGWVSKIDKLYYPIMLYLILKWPTISRIALKTTHNCFVLPLEEIYPGFKATSQPPECPYYLSKSTKDNTTQTTHQIIASRKSKSKSSDCLVRIVPPSYHNFDFLRDVACQTDSHCNNLDQKSFCEPFIKRVNNEQGSRIEKQVLFIRRDCCCTYSSNYETNQDCAEPVSLANYTDEPEPAKSLDSGDSSPKDYGWNLGELLDTDHSDRSRYSPPSQLLSPVSEFTGSANYSYDGYSKFNLLSDTEDQEALYENVKTFDPVGKEEKRTHNEALKEKISKMGWAYNTSPVNDKTTASDVAKTESSNSKGAVTKKDVYTLYYDIRKSLNEELKDKFHKMRIGKEPNNDESSSGDILEVTTGEQEKKSVSSSNVLESASKKSLINVGKIKSKLDFLRIFNARKVKTRKSCSCEQVSSKLKYEKMGSASSML